jgi:hypothetical protein
MLPAPAAIPAMIEVSLPAGFTPADFTREDLIATLSRINADSPARSANAITGTSPAHDTRLASSNVTLARDHSFDTFTSSAFSDRLNQELDTPIFLVQKALSRHGTPRTVSSSTDRG